MSTPELVPVDVPHISVAFIPGALVHVFGVLETWISLNQGFLGLPLNFLSSLRTLFAFNAFRCITIFLEPGKPI